MDGTVTPKGEVGSWEWAEKASEDDLMSWLKDGCDCNRSQHIAVLVKVGERLKMETMDMLDIIFAAEEEASKAAPKPTQAESIMNIIRG